MSDIFISYSKADHALALKLSAFLESEGWSVWWDKSLAAADLYRDEIIKQLAAARAVITIWTVNSVKSDWVRAEAGRAKAEGKLIPVKSADVAYADIPLPFGEMHTENFASTGKRVEETLLKRRSELQQQLERIAVVGGRGGGSTLKGKKVPPKYRGPGGETWAGRGARPRWLVAAIKGGKKLDHFLIDKSARKGRKKRRSKR
jgi:TIR domain-containing protein/H-NS histone family protein